jgi:hypothetical protein
LLAQATSPKGAWSENTIAFVDFVEAEGEVLFEVTNHSAWKE